MLWPEASRHVRNALRSYSVIAVIQAALENILHFERKVDDPLIRLKGAPWLTLLIVKLALEDDKVPLADSPLLPRQKLDELRQVLWKVAPRAEGPAMLWLRPYFPVQLQFQRQLSWSFLRWGALLQAPYASQALVDKVHEIFGTDPAKLNAIMFVSIVQLQEKTAVLSRSGFEQLRDHIESAAVDRFFAYFSRSTAELRQELRAEFDARIASNAAREHPKPKEDAARPGTEHSEFPWLVRHPLLRDGGNYLSWHPVVFVQAMEGAIHRALSPLKDEYTQQLSQMFDRYVVELVAEGLPSFHDEDSIRGGIASRNSVEAILEIDGVNLFVEAKMALFPDSVVMSDQRAEVFMRLKRVREAIVQAWKVSEQLRDGSVTVGHTAATVEEFLLVVTSRQLNMCSGARLANMLGPNVFDNLVPESKFGRPSDAVFARLPPRNVFLLAIDEFENFIGYLQQDPSGVVAMLREAAAKAENLGTSSMHFQQILSPRFQKSFQPSRMKLECDRLARTLFGENWDAMSVNESAGSA